MCSRFVADRRHHLLDDDQLGLWPRGCAQMFKYGEAIFFRPVVDHLAKEEDRHALRVIIIVIPRRLRLKEILGFLRTKKCQPLCQPRDNIKPNNLEFSPGQIRAHLVSSSSSTMGIISARHVVLWVIWFFAHTSIASPVTDSRSWITNRRCGLCLASVKDCTPTPPPTSTTSELSGR